MFSVHITLEEFESGGFTLKAHQMFSVLTTTEKFENATIVHHFGFVFEQNSVKYHMIIVSSSFSKSSLNKMFSNSFGLKGVFEKLRFRDGLEVLRTLSLSLICSMLLAFEDSRANNNQSEVYVTQFSIKLHHQKGIFRVQSRIILDSRNDLSYTITI